MKGLKPSLIFALGSLALASPSSHACTIIGDSIAVGIYQKMPQCELIGVGGINSAQWNRRYNPGRIHDDLVIISLATNDHQYVKTEAELRTVRNSVRAERVYWILPKGNLVKSGVGIASLQEKVWLSAARNDDHVIEIEYVQKDGIHPSDRGYRQIVDQINGKT